MDFKIDIAKKYNRKIYTLSGVWKLRETVRYVPTSGNLSDSQIKRKSLRYKQKKDRVY